MGLEILLYSEIVLQKHFSALWYMYLRLLYEIYRRDTNRQASFYIYLTAIDKPRHSNLTIASLLTENPGIWRRWSFSVSGRYVNTYFRRRLSVLVRYYEHCLWRFHSCFLLNRKSVYSKISNNKIHKHLNNFCFE